MHVYDTQTCGTTAVFRHGTPVMDATFQDEGTILSVGLDGLIKQCGPCCRAPHTQHGLACLQRTQLLQRTSAPTPLLQADTAHALAAPRFSLYGRTELLIGRHDQAVRCVEWLRQRSLLASLGWDSTLRAWDPRVHQARPDLPC